MADVIITLKIMPENVEVNLDDVEVKAVDVVKSFEADVGKVTKEPIAFGLKSLNITLVADESKGSTEDMENKIAEIEGVNSVEVIDVRRAIG